MKDINISGIRMPNNERNALPKFEKTKVKKIVTFIIIFLAIFGTYGSVHFYNKYKALKTDPTIEAQKETARLVGILGKLIELPKDETPTVATISDKDKLKGQSFFVSAENGDILFAYTNSMKAILYRPSINKIINVAPISINQNQDIKQGTTPKETSTSEKSKNQ